MQLMRKVGVAIGPNDINPTRELCTKLEEDIKTIAKEEALKVCLEQMAEVKRIVEVSKPHPPKKSLKN